MLFTMSLLAGCKGSDGSNGANGINGTNGTNGTNGINGLDAASAADYNATIDSVTTATSGTAVTFTVKFSVKSINGAPIAGVGAANPTNATRLAYLRFAYAKLTAGAAAGDSTLWTSYNQSERNPANLTDHGDGTFTYVCTPIDTAVFDAGAHTRVGLQVFGLTGRVAKNVVYDFVPNGSAITVTRDIVTTAACDACHAPGAGKAHGTRYETKYCVVCHTPPTLRNGHTVDFKTLIHEIHTGQTTSALDSSLMTYPQDIRNCTTCHKGTNTDNWKTVPTAAACGSCHTTAKIVSGGTFTGLDGVSKSHSAQATNANCTGCHSATDIAGYHVTEVATENNPGVPAGAVNFTYEVSSVTVTNNTQPVIKFKILKDGIATTFTGTGSTASTVPANAVLAGFTSSPSFLIAFADGTKSTIDHNNLGKAAAQPASVSIAYLLAAGNTRGTITGPVSGEYTATITDPAYGFPAGSKLRTVALQGYFTQSAGTNGIAASTARHTVSVVKEVAGETRRSIVDPVKCSNCHEIFEGHGGNRNISKATTGTIICVLCHNPNLSSSGTTVNLAYAEATQNLKDMIHSIHASGVRTTPYVHYRAKSGAASKYDWSEVEFPGALNNCETCHKPGTYDADLPAGVLMTTDRVGSAATTTTEVATLRGTVDNASDNVTTPVTATCVACHDSTVAKAHMTLNGGQISVIRSSATGVEQCAVCHGVGRSADVVEVHK